MHTAPAPLTARIWGLDVSTVTIGTTYNAYCIRLAQVASESHLRCPGIQAQFRNGYSSPPVSLPEQRKVNFCIVSRREGPRNWVPICRDEMVA